MKALARNPQEAVSLVELLSDETERNRVLDHEALYDAVVEGTDCLSVSPNLYFYVLTRRVLCRSGLDERALTDYVAGVLAGFSHTQQLTGSGGETSARSFGYVCDLMEKLTTVGRREAFTLRSHLGNYALFLSGVFAERVEAHAARRGAPGLSFYEGVGRSSYQTVADHPDARACGLDAIFVQLAEEFLRIRLALNDLTENLMHLTPSPVTLAPPVSDGELW